MKIIKVIYLFIGITIALLVGCVGMESKRYVQDNIFYSSNLPEMKLTVNPDFKYLGAHKTEEYRQSVLGTDSQTVYRDTFVFAQIGDRDLIKKGIIIDFQKIRRSRFGPDIHSGMEYIIDSFSMTIDGEKYQSDVRAISGFPTYLKSFFQDKEYTFSKGYLAKFVGRHVARDQSILMNIIYLEDIYYNDDVGKYPFTKWLNKPQFSEEQKSFLSAFLQRSDFAIKIGDDTIVSPKIGDESIVSPKKKKVLIEAPRYEGIITPIKIPIKPEYKPVEGNYKMLVIDEKNGKTIDERTWDARFTVSPIGELLIWNISLLKMYFKGKHFSPSLPLGEFRILTDKSGKVKEMEVSFPSYEKRGIDLKKILGDEYSKLNNSFGSFGIYVEKPIRTGDFLVLEPVGKSIWESDYDEEAREWFESVLLNPNQIKDMVVNVTLKGWSYYNGKKVAVGEIDERFNLEFKKKIPNFQWFYEISGYVLLDSETFHKVKSEYTWSEKVVSIDKSEEVKSYKLFSSDFK